MSYQLLTLTLWSEPRLIDVGIISLKWLPSVFLGVVFLIALYFYFSRRREIRSNTLERSNGLEQQDIFQRRITKLIIITFGFRFFYAFLLTISQYYIWSKNGLTQLLLNSPLDLSVPAPGIFNKICQASIVNCQKSGYFLFYSYSRFWLNALISIGIASIFYLFLKSLQKHQERFFEAGEIELGFLSALIVGWPNFAVFLPAVFIFVILTSIFRRLFLKELYTTFGIPFLLAALLILIFGNGLIEFFHLTSLRI